MPLDSKHDFKGRMEAKIGNLECSKLPYAVNTVCPCIVGQYWRFRLPMAVHLRSSATSATWKTRLLEMLRIESETRMHRGCASPLSYDPSPTFRFKLHNAGYNLAVRIWGHMSSSRKIIGHHIALDTRNLHQYQVSKFKPCSLPLWVWLQT